MQRIVLFIIGLALVLLVQAAPALASCTYTTVLSGGRIRNCSTCCYGTQCFTQCF
jgi:hypothetical protein